MSGRPRIASEGQGDERFGAVLFVARLPAVWFRSDAIAGLTVWAVLVPESLAYGRWPACSPMIGLYAVPAALILYAAFGTRGIWSPARCRRRRPCQRARSPNFHQRRHETPRR